MSLKICLVIAALFGSAGVGYALPKYPSTLTHETLNVYRGINET
jgi:hypothetical protein